MSHYSDNPWDCRVDLFRPSGKWYTTFVVKFSYDKRPLIHDAFVEALIESGWGLAGGKPPTEPGWFYVCLDPHYVHSHPICHIIGVHENHVRD